MPLIGSSLRAGHESIEPWDPCLHLHEVHTCGSDYSAADIDTVLTTKYSARYQVSFALCRWQRGQLLLLLLSPWSTSSPTACLDMHSRFPDIDNFSLLCILLCAFWIFQPSSRKSTVWRSIYKTQLDDNDNTKRSWASIYFLSRLVVLYRERSHVTDD